MIRSWMRDERCRKLNYKWVRCPKRTEQSSPNEQTIWERMMLKRRGEKDRRHTLWKGRMAVESLVTAKESRSLGENMFCKLGTLDFFRLTSKISSKMQKFDKTFSSAWEKGFYIPTQDAERAKKRLFYNRKIGKKKKKLSSSRVGKTFLVERFLWTQSAAGRDNKHFVVRSRTIAFFRLLFTFFCATQFFYGHHTTINAAQIMVQSPPSFKRRQSDENFPGLQISMCSFRYCHDSRDLSAYWERCVCMRRLLLQHSNLRKKVLEEEKSQISVGMGKKTSMTLRVLRRVCLCSKIFIHTVLRQGIT